MFGQGWIQNSHNNKHCSSLMAIAWLVFVPLQCEYRKLFFYNSFGFGSARHTLCRFAKVNPDLTTRL